MFKFLNSVLIFSTLLFSVLVITSKNPVVSVVFLITVFVSAALILILIGAEFIGIAYILVYVGAVAILFLFVIMMINIKLEDILETGIQYTKSIPLAICIGGLFTFELFSLLNITIPFTSILSYLNPSLNFSLFSSEIIINTANSFNNFIVDVAPLNLENNLSSVYITTNPNLPDITFLFTSQVEAIGFNIYTFGAINLIIISIILLIAMIAALFLSKNSEDLK